MESPVAKVLESVYNVFGCGIMSTLAQYKEHFAKAKRVIYS